MNIFQKIVQTLKDSINHQRPFRYLLCRALVKSGLCSNLMIGRNGYRLWFHQSNIAVSMYMLGEHYYAWEENFIQSLLREGDTFVDIGANIGNLTIAGKLKVKNGKVVAFEAHPRTFSHLYSNISLNEMNIDLRNVAIGEKSGTLLFSDLHADDCNGISTTGSGIVVPVQRLDTALRGLGDIRLLKIDIEGYELMALRAASEILARTKYVYFELGEQMCSRYGYKPSDLLELLHEAGFTIYSVLHSGERIKITVCSDFRLLQNYLAERV
jgi:FkbM family methyltransferase